MQRGGGGGVGRGRKANAKAEKTENSASRPQLFSCAPTASVTTATVLTTVSSQPPPAPVNSFMKMETPQVMVSFLFSLRQGNCLC